MLVEIFLFLILGMIAGTFTGLIPGIHINMIGGLIVSLSVSLLHSVNTVYLVVFITSVAITHTFVDFIPSVFLGCPDTDTELSILPGHKLLNEGRGYEAVMLTCYGGIAAAIFLIFIAFPSLSILPKIYDYIRLAIPYILISISVILIISEREKFLALLVFAISGILGFIVLNLQDDSSKFLLPLLTGLFGSSTIILSMKNKVKIPKQIINVPKIKMKKPLFGAFIASPICSFLPGVGSGQAAIIGNMISRTDERGFLVLLGSTNTLVMGFSFISLYAISKTRTGAAAALQSLLGSINSNILVLIMIITSISSVGSFIITKTITKRIVRKFEKINYFRISLLTLIFLAIVTFLISGFLGIIILIVSTLTGGYCISLNVRRTNMMACLLVPTILLYLI